MSIASGGRCMSAPSGRQGPETLVPLVRVSQAGAASYVEAPRNGERRAVAVLSEKSATAVQTSFAFFLQERRPSCLAIRSVDDAQFSTSHEDRAKNCLICFLRPYRRDRVECFILKPGGAAQQQSCRAGRAPTSAKLAGSGTCARAGVVVSFSETPSSNRERRVGASARGGEEEQRLGGGVGNERHRLLRPAGSPAGRDRHGGGLLHPRNSSC